jgi:hypothetical protein
MRPRELHNRYAARAHSDNLTQAGAEGLANAIRAYWFRKGKFPNVSVVPDKPKGLGSSEWNGSVFVIKSDMIDGFPREPSK